MPKEVKRSGWRNFCRRFSRDNQYRNVRITGGSVAGAAIDLGPGHPFLGIALEKKGRLIDGIQLLAGRGDFETVLDPVAAIKKPAKVVLHNDEQGIARRLELQSEIGDTLSLDLEGGKERGQYYNLVEKVAYDLFQRRGSTVGNDWNDWLEAEKKVKEAEQQLTD